MKSHHLQLKETASPRGGWKATESERTTLRLTNPFRQDYAVSANSDDKCTTLCGEEDLVR